MTKSIFLRLASLGGALLLGAAPVVAKDKPVNSTTFGNVALHGYDPVAYFSEHKPVEGKKTIAFEWKGATWLFANEADEALFKANPDKYAPQYGGYCAYGVSKKKLVDIDPEAWEIVNEKLYLNYSKKVQETWRKERDADISQANENWPQLIEPAK
jgi:hypothetical protein